MLAADRLYARAEGTCTFFSALEEDGGYSSDWVPDLHLITAIADDELKRLQTEWNDLQRHGL